MKDKIKDMEKIDLTNTSESWLFEKRTKLLASLVRENGRRNLKQHE